MNKESRFNNNIVGIVPAILVPVITLIIVYFHSFDTYSVEDFFSFLKTMRVMTKLFSLCVVPNLLVFFIFIWLDYMKSARGVLTATFFIALIIILIQFILS